MARGRRGGVAEALGPGGHGGKGDLGDRREHRGQGICPFHGRPLPQAAVGIARVRPRRAVRRHPDQGDRRGRGGQPDRRARRERVRTASSSTAPTAT